MNGYTYLLLASLSYASMSVVVRSLSTDFGPFTQTFLRLIVSGLLTLLLVILTKKHFLLKHKKDYYLMLITGVAGYGFQIIFFTLAVYHTTIGNTLFINSAYPIITAILAYFFLKEKLTRHIILSLGLLIIAVFLFFNPQDLSSSKYFTGNMYAVLTAISVALYIVCIRIMTKRGNAPETVTLWSVWIAVLTSGIGAFRFETITLPTTSEPWLLLLLFGFFNFAAFNLMNKGFTTIPASTGTMVMMVEPLIGVLLGFLFYHEIPTITFLIGALVLFVAVYIAVFKPQKFA